MKTDELMSKLFGFSIPTYYNWKKENRPIIKLINKYLENEELIEFLEKDSIFSQELLLSIKEQFKEDYEKFTSNSPSHFTFPTKFYYDFLQRFKKDICNISNDVKNNFISLLLEYQLILITIAKEIGYPEINIVKEINYFINLFNKKEETFFIYIVMLVKSNTITIPHYMRKFVLFGDVDYPNNQIVNYKTKDLINIGLESIKKINLHTSYGEEVKFFSEYDEQHFNQQREKDFFEVYEKYLIEQEIPF
ncbi:hypothetical protein [Halarcobacter bivalviorum]|uniref:Uncharacterized protein n=1 Tax=Halarcobacter bivalviorum TaxID=663364 RepID=A0AAX2AEH8_9BACT|nr:hypothetical protein [Halarcobacter bivalviorum]AXH12005.1 hypothetical protein ABIV_1000 [Halarcobacter bivalviorum]RXK11121.1 hypothetical protein CRV05_01770 [Halarcobacter bivalviorum]